MKRRLFHLILPARILFAACLIISSTSFDAVAQDAAVAQRSDFNYRLHRAVELGMTGRFDRSIMAFDDLLNTNPDELLVYRFYARVLEVKGDFKKAIDIYLRALKLANMHEHFNKEEIAEQITALRKKETFSQDLQDIKPWHEATVFSSAGIIFKTNLPMEYNREFFRKVRDLYKKEREVLIEVFGKPDRAPSSLTAYVFGRFEDFEAIMSERASRNKNVFPFDFKAVYFHDDREIFIYYDGGAEFSVLAHELAHHLIQDLYIPSPSRLVSEGFAEYVSYQVAKEDAKREVKDKIEFLKWLDSVGGLEHAFQIFDHWKYYEQAKTRLEYFTARKMFYLIAWSLTQFFLEGGSDFFTDFYAAYVAVESERDSNDIYSTMHYFKEHLSEKEIARLDHDWGAYLLDLNYEQV